MHEIHFHELTREERRDRYHVIQEERRDWICDNHIIHVYNGLLKYTPKELSYAAAEFDIAAQVAKMNKDEAAMRKWRYAQHMSLLCCYVKDDEEAPKRKAIYARNRLTAEERQANLDELSPPSREIDWDK